MLRRLMGCFLLPMLLLGQASGPDRARLASQAQSFAEQLPNLIGTEVLKQKSIRYSNRLRIRMGDAALRPVAPKITEREIRSDLGYALRGKENPVWFELRKVIDVDGKNVTTQKKARERLAFGLTTDDDRARLKMMEEFTKYGLDGVATDYGLSLLIFRAGDIDKIRFHEESSEFLGADRVAVYSFERSDRDVAVTVYSGNDARKQPLRGVVWLRQSDMRPLRIKLISVVEEGKVAIEDEGTVEYTPSKYGSVLPASVAYSRKVNGTLVQETNYTYSGFQKFGSDAEIKFTP
ncbi:hypothetical protein [Bryobacter aggregatus]|uniref:hypothetical protein n=1 Tax=Bryobacter aggregatus TaxID=360054 RepID=UPI0004E1F5E6|nr:hypothetical protein [Bryobacter aggregatus]